MHCDTRNFAVQGFGRINTLLNVRNITGRQVHRAEQENKDVLGSKFRGSNFVKICPFQQQLLAKGGKIPFAVLQCCVALPMSVRSQGDSYTTAGLTDLVFPKRN